MTFNITPPRKDARISREGWRHPKTKELIKIVKFTQDEVDWYNGGGSVTEEAPAETELVPLPPEPIAHEDVTLLEGNLLKLVPETLTDAPVEQTVTETELKEILDQETGKQPE